MKSSALFFILATTIVAEKPPLEKLSAISKDGTRIGFECAGSGPTILFVHGGVGDRTRWTPLFPLLARHFTACAMDRRGRGLSGDNQEYSLMKEAEDIAAVVNSRPEPVYVFGHSYGAVAAIEATFLTNRIAKLMLYEPPLHDPVDNNLAVAAKVESLIQQGDPESAFITFQREVVKQSQEELAKMKTRPNYRGLIATINVHPRQMRALAAYRFDANRVKAIKIPTLLLLGEETQSPYLKQSIDVLKGALPQAKLFSIEAQGHNAMDTSRGLMADIVSKFAQAAPN